MNKVAVIGVGQTKQERNKMDQTFADMVYEATTKALDDAGLTIADIDNVVTVSNDFWDGRTISSMAVQDACGAYGKNVSTVEGDGTFGAFYGMTRILSGSYKTTLVVAHSKGSESDNKLITNALFDPLYVRPLGLDIITASALQARAYMNEFELNEEDFAQVVVKNRSNGYKNKEAQLGGEISISDVMNSPMLADPIKKFDASPISDGAAAVILASDNFHKGKKTPVWIQGVGMAADNYDLGLRDLARCPALKKAATMAYAQAGIKIPLEEIDIVELYDAFSYQELMWCEGLGFCDDGLGKELCRSGHTQITGKLPVNPSGGVLCAHSVITAGLIRIIEAVLQVRGEAFPHQIPKDVKRALAHGYNGACGQSHCVWIVGKGE